MSRRLGDQLGRAPQRPSAYYRRAKRRKARAERRAARRDPETQVGYRKFFGYD